MPIISSRSIDEVLERSDGRKINRSTHKEQSPRQIEETNFPLLGHGKNSSLSDMRGTSSPLKCTKAEWPTTRKKQLIPSRNELTINLTFVTHKLSLQIERGGEDAASDDAALDPGEPRLDLAEPGRVDRTDLHMHLRYSLACQVCAPPSCLQSHGSPCSQSG